MQTLKVLIVNLIGSYTPVEYTLSDGSVIIPSGTAGCDWVFIAAVALFALSLYCVFRLVGVIINAIRS